MDLADSGRRNCDTFDAFPGLTSDEQDRCSGEGDRYEDCDCGTHRVEDAVGLSPADGGGVAADHCAHDRYEDRAAKLQPGVEQAGGESLLDISNRACRLHVEGREA